MKKLKTIAHLSILITTPSLFAYPQNHVPHVVTQKVNWFGEWWWGPQEQAAEWVRPTTYDEIMQTLDDLESGELERRYPPEQLERVNEYLATLAKEGILPNEFDEEADLEEDLYDLLYGEDSGFQLARYLESSSEYMIIPAVFNGCSGYNIVQCGKISKAWEKTKKFVKKHKKEIIIGAVVVVAVTIVAVAVVAASSVSTAAGAAGAVAGAGAGSSDSDHSESKEESPPASTVPKEDSPPIDTNEAPLMKAAIDEHITVFKEFLVEDKAAQQSTSPKSWDAMSLGEKAREVGAGIAHQVLDEVSDLAKMVPELCQEVKELGSKVLPDSLTSTNSGDMGDPVENYENWVAKGHKAIDSAFSTDQAEQFTAEARANDPMNNFVIGVIPVPGVIYKNGTINVKKFSQLGKVSDRAGYTKAGRGSMKHGYREGKTVFEKPIGNPRQINGHGQKVLDDILNHPDKVVKQYTNRRYGPVIEIEAPDLGGVRFTGDGKEMMGFMEPYWLKK